MWFNSKEKCYNGGEQHKFSGRYNKCFPVRELEVKVYSIESFKEKIYICDVCEWCGKKIK